MADVEPTLRNYVDACVPLVWIDTHEAERVVDDVLPEVFSHFKVPVTVFEWHPDMDDCVKYTATLGNNKKGSAVHTKMLGVNSKTLMSWFSQVGEYAPEQLSKYPVVLIIYQPDIAASQLNHDGIFQHSYMYPALAQVAKKFRFCDSYIFLVGSSCHVPDSLKDILAHVTLPLPTHKELREYIKDLLNAYKKNIQIKLPTKKDDLQCLLDDAANAAQGMTLLATENAVSLSLAMHSTLDIPTIFRAKTQILSSSDVLNLVSPDDSVKTLAGFDNYISWLTIRRNIYSQKARDFKLPNPKGVLLVGLPGVGKSTAVKVAASYLNLPLLHLDIGKLYRRMLGESEQAFRLACAVAEAVSPAVLWLDELEKAMAAGGADTDGGASQRILASLLHWRQETKYPIFFIATVNDVDALPPALYRRGRFDAIFAVGSPDPDTRIEIFHIHCAKFGRSLTFTKAQEKFLKEKTQYFSGAEIQSVVSDAMFIAFDADTDLAFEHIAQALKDVYPLNVPGSASVEVFEKWVASNKVSMVS